MPLLYVEARLRKELEDIKAAESKLGEEFMQRRQMLQELSRDITRRLGHNEKRKAVISHQTRVGSF